MEKSPYNIHGLRWQSQSSLAKLTFWSFVFLGLILIFFYRSPSLSYSTSSPDLIRRSLRTTFQGGQSLLDRSGVFIVEGDINDFNLLKKLFKVVAFTHVMHLAAQAGVSNR